MYLCRSHHNFQISKCHELSKYLHTKLSKLFLKIQVSFQLVPAKEILHSSTYSHDLYNIGGGKILSSTSTPLSAQHINFLNLKVLCIKGCTDTLQSSKRRHKEERPSLRRGSLHALTASRICLSFSLRNYVCCLNFNNLK